MRCFLLIIVLAVISSGCSQTAAAPIIIAGSQSTAPPTFLNGGYFGVTPILDQAFSFSLSTDGSFEVDKLQIAVSYSNVFGADSGVQFSIHDDADGLPGAEIATFQQMSVPSTPQVVSVMPEGSATLHSGVRYWLVGQRTQSGQVNVHISDTMYGLYGPVAHRSQNNGWVAQQYGSLPAFVLLGRPVPEPSAAALWSLAVFGLWPRRTR